MNVARIEHSQGRGCRQRSCAAVACWSHSPKVHESCQSGFSNSSLQVASTHPSPIAFLNVRLNFLLLLYEHSSPRRRFLVPCLLRTVGVIHQARQAHYPEVRGANPSSAIHIPVSHRICRALSVWFAPSNAFASKPCAGCLRRTLRIDTEPSATAAGWCSHCLRSTDSLRGQVSCFSRTRA